MQMHNVIEKLVEEFKAKVANAANVMAIAALRGKGLSGIGLGQPSKRRHRSINTGGKRTPKQIERDAQKILAYVKDHPGERMEQIGRTLGYRTPQLTLPMHQLIGAGAIRTRGEKRSRQYFPAGKAG
jgi:hypothetical protein